MPELSSTPWTEADARWLRAQDADDAEFFAQHRKCRHCGKPPEADGDHSCRARTPMPSVRTTQPTPMRDV